MIERIKTPDEIEAERVLEESDFGGLPPHTQDRLLDDLVEAQQTAAGLKRVKKPTGKPISAVFKKN